ncbi:hypothetical protein QQF64_009979 [Cirrhinus molitorella]|uniref:Uncharacterized protein n=1 Tax=Cirrhinus molitorella TaxID=172907 RepID=A0ABR3M2P4_9TELE
MAWGNGRCGCISLHRSTVDWRARAIPEGRNWRRAGQVLVCRCALWVSTFSFNRNHSSDETLERPDSCLLRETGTQCPLQNGFYSALENAS